MFVCWSRVRWRGPLLVLVLVLLLLRLLQLLLMLLRAFEPQSTFQRFTDHWIKAFRHYADGDTAVRGSHINNINIAVTEDPIYCHSSSLSQTIKTNAFMII